MGIKKIDPLTGTMTTGHEWDGIEELNNPVPIWWVWTFLACILFALVYIWMMPSWPTTNGYQKGLLEWNSRERLDGDLAEARAAQRVWLEQIAASSLREIEADDDLRAFARTGGKAAFNTNCAGCHGVGGGGQVGIFPVLADDDWLWGGTIDAIYQTILYGIRTDNDDTRFSQMPAFGADGILEKPDIAIIADFVLSLSEQGQSSESGAALFEENCSSCHGAQGEGIQDFGAPALNDFVWLYGSEKADVVRQVNQPRHGRMPQWTGRLSDETVRMLAVYVYGLGGGVSATE